MIVFAGPNGAGKTTIYERLKPMLGNIKFISADDLVKGALADDPHNDELAQKVSDITRSHYVKHQTSFVTETVFSDPVGAKLELIKAAQAQGFRVVLISVLIPTPAISHRRVTLRVQNGGHDVPSHLLKRRHEWSLKNITLALDFVDLGIVFDNTGENHHLMAVTELGQVKFRDTAVPQYIEPLLPTATKRRTKK